MELDLRWEAIWEYKHENIGRSLKFLLLRKKITGPAKNKNLIIGLIWTILYVIMEENESGFYVLSVIEGELCFIMARMAILSVVNAPI